MTCPVSGHSQGHPSQTSATSGGTGKSETNLGVVRTGCAENGRLSNIFGGVGNKLFLPPLPCRPLPKDPTLASEGHVLLLILTPDLKFTTERAGAYRVRYPRGHPTVCPLRGSGVDSESVSSVPTPGT